MTSTVLIILGFLPAAFGVANPATCVMNYLQSATDNPSIAPSFVVSDVGQQFAYLYANFSVKGVDYVNEHLWCVDYTQFVTIGEVYTASPVYTWESFRTRRWQGTSNK